MDKNLLRKELRIDEGFVSHVYSDSLGYSTIGIGRMVDKRLGGGITETEALYLLGNDIDRVWEEVKKKFPWIVDQPESVQRAICNMTFQMGINGVAGFKNSLAYIKAGEYDKARSNMKASKWYGQTPNRAKRVIDMIRKD
jgi:lysozyme